MSLAWEKKGFHVTCRTLYDLRFKKVPERVEVTETRHLVKVDLCKEMSKSIRCSVVTDDWYRYRNRTSDVYVATYLRSTTEGGCRCRGAGRDLQKASVKVSVEG